MHVRPLGRMPYRDAWSLQKLLVEWRGAERCGDTLLLVEHPAVVTTGRGSAGTPSAAAHDAPFEVVAVERGGETTYHGPGQIVAYPIVKLHPERRDLHAWLRALEQALIDTLTRFELRGERRTGATGVWVDGGRRKLASIGVAASRWVTYHGLALNHTTDLSAFGAIRPCGFDASIMTSIEAECARVGLGCPSRAEVEHELARCLQAALGRFRAPRVEADAPARSGDAG